MTTGVIYARVSSIGDRQSTERQVKDLSEYAKYKGIEVYKVFEEHISGAKKNDSTRRRKHVRSLLPIITN